MAYHGRPDRPANRAAFLQALDARLIEACAGTDEEFAFCASTSTHPPPR